MNKKPLTFLKNFKPTPLVQKESGRLWRRVASRLDIATVENVTPVGAPSLFVLYRRPAFAFVAGLLLVFGSGMTAEAANNAGPGDLLYPVDLAMERARLAITSESRGKALRYQYALERIDELAAHNARVGAQIQASPNRTNTPVDNAQMNKLEEHMRYVEQYLDKETTGLQTQQRTRLHEAFSATASSTEHLQIRERERIQSETTATENERAAESEEEPMTGGGQFRFGSETNTTETTQKTMQIQTQTNAEQINQNETETEPATEGTEPEQKGEQNGTGTTSETSGEGQGKQSGQGGGQGGKR